MPVIAGTGNNLGSPTADLVKNMAEIANVKGISGDLGKEEQVDAKNQDTAPNGGPVVPVEPVISAVCRMTIEIVGLHDPLRGRNCERHFACGETVQVHTILRLKNVKIWLLDKQEDAIAAYLVEGGVETCRVGFLRRHAIKYGAFYNNRLVQVVALSCESPDRVVRRRSYAMKGIAKAFFI